MVQGVDLNASDKNAQQQHEQTLASVVPDGTYTNNVSYRYHSGTEVVTISVTLKNETITAISVTGNNPNFMSARYISAVNAALPDLVAGKRIDQLSIPQQVSGSSLTSAAVRQYLEDVAAGKAAMQ